MAKSPRQTALLKIIFEDDKIGFANLHPNPERLGTTLEQELKSLAEGKLSQQARQSLMLAHMDAEARAAGKSLWEGLEIPSCHYLVTEFSEKSLHEVEAALKKGFRKFKIKTGRDLPEEIRLLNLLASSVPPKSLRPDFNQALSMEQLQEFVRGASPTLIAALDFVEDPTEHTPAVWYEFSRVIPWAWDQHSERIRPGDKGFRAVVVKPALQDIDLMWPVLKNFDVQIAFTSYMDHPVGQMGAAFIAAKFYQQHPEKRTECGLMSQTIFEPTIYSECLKTDGPQLLPPQGIGIGFGDLLEKENWKPL